MIGGQLKSRLNMKDFTSFAPLDFLCNKWRGSNLRPLTNPNKYHQLTSNACQHCVVLLPSCLSGFSGSGHDLDSCILIH